MLEALEIKTSQFILMHYFVTLEQEFFRQIVSPFIESNKHLRNSICNHKKYSPVHNLLIGRSHPSLGAIPFLGKFVDNEDACNYSEAISCFTDYLDTDILSFKAICEQIENTKICGMPLTNIRNGLAHGDNLIIKQIDDSAYYQLREFLICSPSSIIERIVEISHID